MVNIKFDKILEEFREEDSSSGYLWEKFKITIPWEILADTTYSQWIFLYNDTDTDFTINNVNVRVAWASNWTCSINLYKSSWTNADWINTNAVALFTNPIALGTTYLSGTNVPNIVTIEPWRFVSLRVTDSTWTTLASDMQVTINYN